MSRECASRRVYRSRAVRRRRSLLFVVLLAALTATLVLAGTSGSRDLVRYDRVAAAAYADEWAMSSNPECWASADSDCANFVSQCVAAGGLRPIYQSGCEWHDGLEFPSVSWVNVGRQKAVWSTGSSGQSSPYIVQSAKRRPSKWAAGDVVYLGNVEDGVREWQHVIICVGREGGEWVYDSHTVAYRHRPIGTWYPEHFSLIRYCRLADAVSYH